MYAVVTVDAMSPAVVSDVTDIDGK